MDCGEFNQAADWFEMAASHAPDSASLKQRADQARRRVDEVEALATAKKLGIPSSRNKMYVCAGGLLAFVVAICALAFYLGGQVGNAKPKTINTPLTLSPAPSPNETGPMVTTKDGFALPDSDARLLKTLQETSALGARILLAYRDPRGPSLVVSLEAPPGEFTTKELSDDAGALLTEIQDATAVTVRYLRAGESLAIAKPTRTERDAALTANKPASTALEDIWPNVEAPKPDKPAATETQGASTESVTVPATDNSAGQQGH